MILFDRHKKMCYFVRGGERMRSTIDLNPELLEKTMRITGAKTKKELINLSLEELLRASYRVRLKSRLGHCPLDLTLKKLEQLRANG
jgi:Arc/MetJ family transcription regulator